MKIQMVIAGIVMIGMAGFQLATGGANGPATFGLSVILVVLGVLSLIAAAVVPSGTLQVARMIAAVIIGVVAMGFLGFVAVMATLQKNPPAVVFANNPPQQRNVGPPPPPPAQRAPRPRRAAVPDAPIAPPEAPPVAAIGGEAPLQVPPQAPAVKPEYVPPPSQPGAPTELVGGPGGWQFQEVDPAGRAVVGFRYTMGSWAGQPAVADFVPLFDRNAADGGTRAVARADFVVGGLQIVATDLVNAVRVVFVRQQSDGTLDKSDSYLSEWIGNPGSQKPREIGDRQSRVIGVCGRNGSVKNAVALVLDNAPAASAAGSNSPPAVAAAPNLPKRVDPPNNTAQPSSPGAVPEYVPPAGQPGKPTALAGGPEGWQFQMLDDKRRPVIGFRTRMGSWARQPAVAQFDPLFDREQPTRLGNLVVAREGYVVWDPLESTCRHASLSIL